MPVGMISTPCLSNRWLPEAFGILGDPNTYPFRDSPYTSHRSMRLFFQRFLRALNESLSDTQTGIAVGMVAHLALWAQAERGARSVALHRFSLVVANDVCVAAMAFSTRVARVHAAGDNTPCVPRLIFAIAEDAAFHPVGAFHIAPARIRALFGLEIAQMLKDKNARPMRFRELDNASADEMRDMFINVSDLAPEICIVLFVFRNDASLRSVACNAAKQALPKARYRCTISDEGGGQDGAFGCLDAAHS